MKPFKPLQLYTPKIKDERYPLISLGSHWVAARELGVLALVRGQGYHSLAYVTKAGQVMFVRKYYKVLGLERYSQADPHTLCSLASLAAASKRGRIMTAILGSPYDVLYNRMRSLFPEDEEEQLQCAALCKLTLKQLGIWK